MRARIVSSPRPSARALWRAPRRGPTLAHLHHDAVGDDIDLPDQVQHPDTLVSLQQRDGPKVELLEGPERVLDRADERVGDVSLLRVAAIEVDDGAGALTRRAGALA